MEIKNKLTVTKGEGNNRGKKGKGHQGTCVKDPWTKTTEGEGLNVVGEGETRGKGMEITLIE